jgi:hypothetical protein
MKPTGYIIRIAAPCQEHWAGMSPAQRGRHCAACCRTVIDLTRMSDEAILLHLNNAKGSTCGRLRHNQLNRVLAAPVQASARVWPQVLAGALLVAATSTAQAQAAPSGSPEIIICNELPKPLRNLPADSIVPTQVQIAKTASVSVIAPEPASRIIDSLIPGLQDSLHVSIRPEDYPICAVQFVFPDSLIRVFDERLMGLTVSEPVSWLPDVFALAPAFSAPSPLLPQVSILSPMPPLAPMPPAEGPQANKEALLRNEDEGDDTIMQGT